MMSLVPVWLYRLTPPGDSMLKLRVCIINGCRTAMRGLCVQFNVCRYVRTMLHKFRT